MAKITAHVEPIPHHPGHFQICFRINGVLVGHGLMTFNDRSNAEHLLEQLLKGDFDVQPT